MGITKYFSTSEVAAMCDVHRNTIIAAIRNGRLSAYRTPGGHARVAYPDIVRFCREQGLPLRTAGIRKDKVLVVTTTMEAALPICAVLEKQQYRVRLTDDLFEAGFLAVSFSPDAVVLDANQPTRLLERISRRLRASRKTQATKMIGWGSLAQRMMQKGANIDWDDYIETPCAPETVVARLIAVMGPMNSDVPVGDESTYEMQVAIS